MKLKTHTWYLLLMLASNLGLNLAAFGGDSSGLQFNQLAAAAPALKDNYILQLGGGYSTFQHQRVLNCLVKDDNPGDDDITWAEAKLARHIDYTSATKSFGIDETAGAGLFKLIGVTGELDFLFDSTDTELSQTFLYSVEEHYPTTGYYTNKSIPKSRLNDNGQHYYDAYKKAVCKRNKKKEKQALKEFYGVCGDSYVTSLHHIASLYVAVQLQFTSHEDALTFKAGIHGDVPTGLPGVVGSLGNTWKTILKKNHITADIKISATQRGGVVANLANLFIDDTDADLFSKTCTLNNLEACETILTNINTYIKEDFPSQVNDNNWKEQSSVSANFEISPYSRYLGLPEYDEPEVSDAVKKIRKHLYKQLMETIQQRNLNNELIKITNNVPYVYDDYTPLLEENISTLDVNTNILRTSGEQCFTQDPETDCHPTTVKDLPVSLSLPDTWTITQWDKQNGENIAKHLLVLRPRAVTDAPLHRTFRGIKKPFKQNGAKGEHGTASLTEAEAGDYDTSSLTEAEEISDPNNPASIFIREYQADTDKVNGKLLKLGGVADYTLFPTDTPGHYTGSMTCISASKSDEIPCNGYIEADLTRQSSGSKSAG